jgi:flagellar hook-basal body complex protein FliE
MSVSSIDQMRAQMQVMAAQAGSQAIAPKNDAGGFADLLKDSLGKVNELQQTSNSMAQGFERGSDEFSLAEVMVAKQKSGIAFQATLQVRNKLVESYKEVMSMSI